MSKKTIMLACAAGMSTSLMVTKMQDAAIKRGRDFEIFAVPATGARMALEETEVDLVLLGPQLSFMVPDFERLLDGKDVPIGIINMLDYGMMNGENTIDFAIELLEQ